MASCMKCGETYRFSHNCKMAPATGGGHKGTGKRRRTKGYQGKHAKPALCTHTWSTARPAGAPATGHYDHACGNENAGKGGDGNQCNGRHVCRNFHCHETS